MKRLLTFSILAVLATVFFASCSKRDHYNNSYKENGVVTYISEVNSPYSVVRMDDDGTYAVIYSTDGSASLWPEINDLLYGDFAEGGNRNVTNKTIGKTIRIEVDDFFDYRDDAISYVINKEDSEGYAASFKKSNLKIQRRVVGSSTPVIK